MPTIILVGAHALVSRGEVRIGVDQLSLAFLGALALLLGSKEARSIGILLLGCCAGIAGGIQNRALQAEPEELIAQFGRSHFLEVRVSTERGWLQQTEGSRLTASGFEILGPQGRRVDLDIQVYGPPSVPDIFSARSTPEVVARGFLRRSLETGRLYLTVKSWKLVRPVVAIDRDLGPGGLNSLLASLIDERTSRSDGMRRIGSLMKAVALGRGEDLDDETKESYRRAGTYHLLVFSGLQIAICAGLMIRIAGWLGIRRLRYPALMVVAVLSPAFAGAEPSVTRAALMVGLLAGSRMLSRPTPIENLFFISIAFRLGTAPAEISDPGFWLTYAATGGMIFVGKPMAARCRSAVVQAAIFGISAEVATTPLTLFFFGHYVLGGGLVTMAVAPVMMVVLIGTWCICLMLLAGADGVAEVALNGVAVSFEIIDAVNSFSAEVLGLGSFAAPPPLLVVVAAYFLAGVIIVSRGRPWVIVVMLIVPSAWSIAGLGLRAPSEPTLTALDVGQGDAILLQDGEVTILVDGGGRRDDPGFWRRKLIPQLERRAVNRIDLLVVSHPDSDHCAALPGLVSAIDVERIWISARHLGEPCSDRLIDAAVARGVAIGFPVDRDAVQLGAFDIQVVMPRLTYKRATLNNGSIALSVKTRRGSAFLAGDLEEEAEATLAAEEAGRLGADILKVGHHGSRRSTSTQFLTAVKPCVAIISAGRDNSFGHPHQETLERLRAAKVSVRRTDLEGPIRMNFHPPECLR